ncbi:hypothetical protein [Halorussus amylolyticus]|uniref:hypothetical protein n=1 Tax=Halorussus amylolyticus TaxID=1126242 RepID=UPI00104FD4BD|nr:hypothetical protein [Halorussus amylolyticus]
MSDTDLICAILRVLVSDHAYGNPRPRDVILDRASYPRHRGGAAKEAYETVRSQNFVLDYGDRGIKLDNSEFGSLVQFLHERCGWKRFELELRIKHFEGWDEIRWND